MDPDGLSILFFMVCGAAAIALAWVAGAVCADNADRDARTCLGFSTRMAGVGACFLLACACFFGGAMRTLSAPGVPGKSGAQGLAQAWVLLCGVALGLVCILVFALGRARSGDAPAFTRIFGPIGAVFAAPARLVFRLARLTAVSEVTEEDLFSMVDDVEEQDLIDENQKEMIEGIFELNDVTAGEIMTHRTEVVAVEENATAAAVVQLAVREGVSRMPVYRKTMDDIVGVVYVKDLFTIWDDSQKGATPVREFMRAAMFVPEACRARALLVDFKLRHTHIAVVVDEYGGTSGIVTMEDILEEIVGNIQDEFDNEEEELVPIPGGVIASGSADLEDVFDALGLVFPEEEAHAFDSVGGLVIDKLGRIPTPREDAAVPYAGVLFTVLEVSERRVAKVQCTVQAAQE